MIQNPADHKPRDTAARHQTRCSPTKVMTTDISFVPSPWFRLLLADNVCARALRETASHVFVVAHERLRKHPHILLIARHSLQDLPCELVEVDTVGLCVLGARRRFAKSCASKSAACSCPRSAPFMLCSIAM